MFKAITTSDNTANDKLMRSVGGPEAVRAMIARKGLGAIRFYDGERALQSEDRRADLEPELFDRQRLLRRAQRACRCRSARRPFDRYVDDPYDGAAPSAIVTALPG